MELGYGQTKQTDCDLDDLNLVVMVLRNFVPSREPDLTLVDGVQSREDTRYSDRYIYIY